MTSSATNDAAAKLTGSDSPASPLGCGLPRAARLRRADDIRQTMRRGHRKTSPLVDVIWISSPFPRPRVAVIVPRYGHTAVDRNRVRRRLLHIVRTRWMPSLFAEKRGLDFVLRAKPAAYQASYDALSESLTRPMEALCVR